MPEIDLPVRYDPSGTMILDANGNLLLNVRGWGRLTGTGARNLPDNEAVQIQDEYGKWIAGAINEHENLKSKLATLRQQLAERDAERELLFGILGCALEIEFETGSTYRQDEFGWRYGIGDDNDLGDRELDLLNKLSNPPE